MKMSLVKDKETRNFIFILMGEMVMERYLIRIDNLFVSLLTFLLCEHQCPLVTENITVLQRIVTNETNIGVMYTEDRHTYEDTVYIYGTIQSVKNIIKSIKLI